jgi:hypothetical protein
MIFGVREMIGCLESYSNSNSSSSSSSSDSKNSSNSNSAFASAKDTVLLAVVYFYTVILGAVAASLGG